MENGVDSLYTKPKNWDEWVIGTFDPTFKKKPYFFQAWEQNVNHISALLVFQETGYDKARRFAPGEVDDEMMLVQACVGPDIYVYKMPYLPPLKPKTGLQTMEAKASPQVDHLVSSRMKSCISTAAKHIEEPALFFVAITAALLILSVLGL